MSAKEKGNYEKELQEMLRDQENAKCGDCGQKGPRWASYNLGVFLCIRCGGLHRKLGTHLSKVRSITLDQWTLEQIQQMQKWGNVKANKQFCPRPELFPVPTNSSSDGDMEMYIRDKYEYKKLMFPESSNSRFKISVSPQTAEKYQHLVKQLQAMGYQSNMLCLYALQEHSGNVQDASQWLQKQPRAVYVDPPSFDERRKSFMIEQEQRRKSEEEQRRKSSANSTTLVAGDDTVQRSQIQQAMGNVARRVDARSDSGHSIGAKITTPVIVEESLLLDVFSTAPNNTKPADVQQNQSQSIAQVQPQNGTAPAIVMQPEQSKPMLNKNSILALYNQPSPIQLQQQQQSFTRSPMMMAPPQQQQQQYFSSGPQFNQQQSFGQSYTYGPGIQQGGQIQQLQPMSQPGFQQQNPFGVSFQNPPVQQQQYQQQFQQPGSYFDGNNQSVNFNPFVTYNNQNQSGQRPNFPF
ncbi:hypothetical protein MP228_003957 [Amoeboaphelidium protococcarum]|nr:hypothetical protein MP228_003957 [Amoeboaphelidium protococcarum]